LLKTDTDQPVVGEFINRRYKTVQVLGAGAFGQAYITEDTWLANNPQCVVKHFKPKSHHPEGWQVCQRLFANETVMLNQLGNHDQIPRFLDCFEDKQGFYLVQELIVGESLSAKLPVSKHCNKRWSEVQCVAMLQDVLKILEFVHNQGLIHGDLKPNNLIERSYDGKYVLIDFGAAHRIKGAQVKPRVIPIQPAIASVAIPPVGYIPAEQLSGQSCPSSDLYALGMIAIEALTGLNPMQLHIDPDSGEIDWQQQVAVSDSMACLLNHMVRYNFKDRYQSASDVLTVLKRLSIRSEEQGVRKEELSQELTGESPLSLQSAIASIDTEELKQYVHIVSPSPENNFDENQTLDDSESDHKIPKEYYVRELAIACWPKLPPLLTGIGAGMATSNAAAISLGLYSLFHTVPSNPGLDLLERAKEQYEAGNFDEAIALAESIPLDSSAYKESVTATQKWRKQWDIADTQFRAVKAAFEQKQWRDVFKQANATPNIKYWQEKIAPFVLAAKPELEAESQQLLQQAYELAAVRDFTGALALLKQIPKETSTGAQIQPKLMEYTQKQQIKAQSLLQQAYKLAAEKDFTGALKYLAEIPEETPAYQTAQIKTAEYSQKQVFNEETQRQTQLNARFPKEAIKLTKLPKNSQTAKPSKTLNPGSHLKEVTPKPVRPTPARTPSP